LTSLNGERFRGSSEIPLTDEGVQTAAQTAMKMARKGGLDEIQTSNLGRTIHTAKIFSKYTHAPITYVGDGLHPWHLGSMEGQPVTDESAGMMNRLITDAPDQSLEGRGPQSTADGESFNAFKTRTLGKLQELIGKTSSNPEKKIGVVTHYRVKKLMDSWMRRGMDPSGDIDSTEMTQRDSNNSPGGVDRFTMDPELGPQMHAVDLEGPGQLQGGVYFIRHEKTAWNSGKQGS